MKRIPTLTQFLRGNANPAEHNPGCANYDHDHSGCLMADKCKVEEGKRCGYFEKAVLPNAASEGYAAEMNDLYARQTGATPKPKSNSARLCPDCSGVLPPRHRVCPKCAEKRRQKAYRDSKAKSRHPLVHT